MSTNTLEFFVKMKDLMSGGLANVQTNAKKAFGAIDGYIKKTADNNRLLNNSLDDTHKKVERNGNAFGALGRNIKIALAATAALSFARSSVQAAAQFGATQKSFEVLLGSKAAGGQLSGALNALQQNTILGPEVFEAAQTMLGFGVAADKVLPSIKMLGDVSMGDAQKLESLTLAFSQVQAAGRLTGQDLLQFINAGFNPLQDMSITTGKSLVQLKKDMENGAISAGMVTAAFEHATGAGGKFNGMMNQMADTTYGKMQILSGQWENFKIQAGNALLPIANDLLTVAGNTLEWLNISKTAPQVLMGEQAQINSLVGSITNLNEGNETRSGLFTTLQAKYPDLFGNLDKEKTENYQLLDVLNKVNTAYNTRISLASSNLLLDTNNKILTESKGEEIRLTAIRSALAEGNIAGAKSLMTATEAAHYGLANYFGNNGAGAKVFSNKLSEAQSRIRTADGVIAGASVDKTVAENIDLVNTVRGLTAQSPMYAAAIQELSYYDSLAGDIYAKPGLLGVQGGFGRGSYDYNRLKKFLPSSVATGAASGGTAAAAGGTSKGKDIGSSIASGGPRVININGVKFTDKIELHTATFKEGVDDMQRLLEEMFLRVLNSGAKVQA